MVRGLALKEDLSFLPDQPEDEEDLSFLPDKPKPREDLSFLPDKPKEETTFDLVDPLKDDVQKLQMELTGQPTNSRGLETGIENPPLTLEQQAREDALRKPLGGETSPSLAERLAKLTQAAVPIPDLPKTIPETIELAKRPILAPSAPIRTKEGRRILGAAGAGAAGSIGSTAGALPAAEKLLNVDTPVGRIGQEVADALDKLAKELQPDDPNFAEKLGSGAGSMATFMVPGIGTAALTASLPRFGVLAAKLAPAIQTSVSTVLESATEAGGVYQDLIKQGMKPELAAKSAFKDFLGNVVLVGITNRFGLFGDKFQGLKKALVSAPLEAIQEAGQSILQAVTEGLDINWKEVAESLGVGFIVGGGASQLTTINRETLGDQAAEYLTSSMPALAQEIDGQSFPVEKEVMREVLTKAAAASEEVNIRGGTPEQANAAAVQTFQTEMKKVMPETLAPEQVGEATERAETAISGVPATEGTPVPKEAETPEIPPVPPQPTPVEAAVAPSPARETLKKDLIDKFRLPEQQAESVTLVADARAQAWSKSTGKPAEEWYASRIGGVREGGEVGTLKQDAPPVPTFFSKAESVLSEKMPNSAPVEQVRGILSPENGVKKEEMDWLGLEQFLAGKEKVSKQELVDFIKENQVRVEEVVKGQRKGSLEWDGKELMLNGETVAVIEEDKNTRKWRVYDAYVGKVEEGLIDEAGDIGSAIRLAEQFARQGNVNFQEAQDTTKFSKYTLPGGENYRELLLTLPPQERAATEREIEQGYTDKATFKSPHFDEPNVLAHVRFNEREGPNGEKILFIEEIQSDWMQQGRQKGFRTDAEPQTRKSENGEEWIVTVGKEEHRIPTLNFGTRLIAEKYVMDKYYSDRVPDAPFKKTWHELAMKRILRWGAENGFDAIAWTTGEIQADRYDLSKQVHAIAYKLDSTGSYWIEAKEKPDGQFRLLARVTKDNLVATVGKDLAGKIVAGEGKQEGDYKQFSGIDLKVGGEGMKGFYDQMIPSFLNKYTKKWGGRVEKTSIGGDSWDVVNTADDTVVQKGLSEQGAIAAAAAWGKQFKKAKYEARKRVDTAVHSLDITPSMKESVMQGQPLFQGPKGSAEFIDDHKAIITAFGKADVSTAIHELAHVFRRDLAGNDLTTTEEWAGVKEGKWTVEAEERFARGFERYVAEGKAPNNTLARVFEKFKEWLLSIYNAIAGSQIDVEISPEMKGVFDRLLGAEESVVAPPSPPGPPSIPRMEGQFPGKGPKEPKLYTERQALRRSLQRQAVAAAEADSRARKEAAYERRFLEAEAKFITDIEVGKVKSQAKRKAEEIQKIKNEVMKAVKANLPLSEQGRFIGAVKSAKTGRDLAKAVIRVDAAVEKLELKEAISTLKKTANGLKESSSISIDYIKKIADVIGEYELSGHSDKMIQQLKDTREYVRKAASIGENVELPARLLDKLQILDRVPKDQLTLSQVQGLQSQLELLGKLGETKLAAREAIYASEKEYWKNRYLATSAPVNSRELTRIPLGQQKTRARVWAERYIKLRNGLQKNRIALTPIDGLAEMTGMLDMKAKHDLNYGNYAIANDKRFEKLFEIVKRRGLNDVEIKEIGAYAAFQQKGGEQRLTENNKIPLDELKGIKLSEGQKELYDFIIEENKAVYPRLKKWAMDEFNVDIGEVENYVSFHSDFDEMNDLAMYDRFGTRPEEERSRMRTKQTEKGFIESRTKVAKNPLELDIVKVFIRHMDDAEYSLNMSRDIRQDFEIVNSPEMKQKLGDVGALSWLQWLDLMARKGGQEGAKRIPKLDLLRKNLAMGVLGYRLSSALVQFTSFGDSVATIGAEYATKGASAIATSSEARRFVFENFPEVRKAVGDDIAFREFDKTYFEKMAKVGITPLKVLDGMMRSSAVMGAYMKLADEKGVEVNLSKPDKGLIQEATRLMRHSQGSSFFKDQPLALSAGYGLFDNKSMNKTILTFQSFMLNRWDNIQRQTWRMGIKEGRYGKAAASVLWFYVFAVALEMGIRRGNKVLLDLLTGDDDDRKDSVLADYLLNVAQTVPIFGSVVSSLTYGSTPIPIINAVNDVFEGGTTVIKGKRTLTKLKGAVKVAGAVGSFIVPGASQLSQILQKAIPSAKNKKKQKERTVR